MADDNDKVNDDDDRDVYVISTQNNLAVYRLSCLLEKTRDDDQEIILHGGERTDGRRFDNYSHIGGAVIHNNIMCKVCHTQIL
jgi:hypothetical protein